MNKRAATFLFILISLASCSGNSDKILLDLQEDFVCNGLIKYEAWGANGMAKTCINSLNLPDGSYFIAENGRLFLKGTYVNGNESGTWTWFDKYSKPVKTIAY